MSLTTIDTSGQETRLFKPTAEFSQSAHIKSLEEYQSLYDRALAEPENFWAELAASELHWFEQWERVLDWQPPFAQWFVGGKLNVSYNCLDRHLNSDRRDKTALIWAGERGNSRRFTYAQLHQQVCQMANVLKRLGVQKHDRVGIYMPMIPEAAIAMLACARIGAVHVVVSGEFNAEALKERLLDAQAKVVITADGGWHQDAIAYFKDRVDRALVKGSVPSVEQVLVVKRTGQTIHMEPDRDQWWHKLQKEASEDCPAEPMDSEDTLFILYTSGITDKPKGVVQTTGGYSLYTHITTKWIFDLKESDLFWCTADIGWMPGHSYTVYGPLSNGATTVMYEGVPRASNSGCLLKVVEKYGVTIFYTTPTFIRMLMKMGEALPKARLSSLRLLGTVGEPMNPATWMWFYRVIGGERCPIVNTWWQTETGGAMLAPLPGAIPTKPGSVTLPFPGVVADVVDSNGNPVGENQEGYLAIEQPWPSMIRTLYNHPNRFLSTYWEKIPPQNGQYFYFTGDSARRDRDGYFWIVGRVDPVINKAGQRLSLSEIESALVSHLAVAEAAVVGKPSELQGEEIVAFVVLKASASGSKQLGQELKRQVVKKIGAIARPAEVRFMPSLPKSASGRVMRRLLRSLVAGEEVTGAPSRVEGHSVVEQLRGEA